MAPVWLSPNLGTNYDKTLATSLSPSLKTNEIRKRNKKRRQASLTIKNVIVWNSTLVTYTYIYKRKIIEYLHWIFNVCFVNNVCEK